MGHIVFFVLKHVYYKTLDRAAERVDERLRNKQVVALCFVLGERKKSKNKKQNNIKRL